MEERSEKIQKLVDMFLAKRESGDWTFTEEEKARIGELDGKEFEDFIMAYHDAIGSTTKIVFKPINKPGRKNKEQK